jgi:transposase
MPRDPVVLRPGEHGVGSELGPVVRHDHAGLPTTLDQHRQFARVASARDRGVGDRRQALSRHVIDDVQDAEPPASGELVMNKIQRPAGVGSRLDQDRRPRSHSAPPTPSLAHRQAFFAIEPVDPVDSGRFAVLAQQDEQAPIADIRFLNAVEREVPAGKTIHAVIDNYAAHKHPSVRQWLARHPRWTFHFTPTSASWLNAVEGFFAVLTKRRLKRGVFRSVADLQAAINRFLNDHNAQSTPFQWVADPDKIIAAVRRGHQVLDSIN